MRERRELEVAAISFQREREREMRAETSKCKGV